MGILRLLAFDVLKDFSMRLHTCFATCILLAWLHASLGQEAPTPDISEIINKTLASEAKSGSVPNETWTFKEFYSYHEERAKRDVRKRLNLSTNASSTFLAEVKEVEFGRTDIDPKSMLECWWETLETDMITRFFMKKDMDAQKANCQSEYRETALHYCNVPNGGDPACTAAALRIDGIEIDVIDEHGTTALFWAVHNGHLLSAAMLIDAGADMELTDKTGKALLDHATTEDMRKLVKNPLGLASKIISQHSEDLAAKAASLTKMGAPTSNTSSHVLRADILGKDYNKDVVKLSMFNWDEEIHVKLQVEKKAAIILFVSTDCSGCEEAEKVLHAVSKKHFSSKPRYYIMDAMMDEPPRPFGKQAALPSMYFRGIVSPEGKKKRTQDMKPTVIKFGTGGEHGKLTNETDITKFIESNL